ncbi:S8 family serine peptidase [Ectothiorhodospira lacustris]|uniref:S8 family serine peptidase n=1 Tax=Ectothiorhodospira lacustris TaxID=2899127 RepID=UPI001EE8B9E7|nr:S8 family serine peptidase [Ectothiorhodospira lacustris]MCG5510767.1 S8 family serine peptidase [Ectothiorhodospira lacustris]MCG5522499.1 S8 family serine peptidase [Ectothiorhodospira lacustris]
MRRSLEYMILCLCLLAPALSGQESASSQHHQGDAVIPLTRDDMAVEADDILIRLRDETTAFVIATHRDALGPRTLRRGWRRAQIPPGMDLESAILWYRQQPGVAHAEPNYRIRLTALYPNDPLFSDQWALFDTENPHHVRAPGAWGLSTDATQIVVGVLDSGIDHGHEDLRDSIWQNPNPQTEADCPGRRSEGLECYPDDHNGWSFVSNRSANPPGNDAMDDNGHGTHVAGIIGARGDNALGITGISWQASLLPLKFLAADGTGHVSDAVEAIYYAAEAGRAHIINASYEYRGNSQAEYEAIAYAREQGVILVAAAGNSGLDLDQSPVFPAAHRLDNIIVVSASTRTGTRLRSSNFGADTVHLSAPGQDILSTWPTTRNCSNSPAAGYCRQTGTSMAAPMVTGAAALLWAHDPALTRADWKRVRERVLLTVAPTEPPHPTLTGGLLDLSALLHTDPATLPPFQPTHLQGTGTSSGVQLEWLNNSPRTDYLEIQRCLRHQTAEGRCETNDFLPLVTQADGQLTQYLDSSATLSEATAYEYRIRAGNNAGLSSWSPALSLETPPLPPSELTVESTGQGIRLRWRNHPEHAEHAQWLQLDRRIGNSAYQALARLSPQANTYLDPVGDMGNVQLRYRLCAGHDATGCSEYLFSRAVSTVPGNDGRTRDASSDDRERCLVSAALGGSRHARAETALAELRRFRDEKLAATDWGRQIIARYYHISPTLVRWMDRHAALESLASGGLMALGLALREIS